MSNMMMNVEVGQYGGGRKVARFVMVARGIQQDRVKHHSEICQKWHDIIEGCIPTGKFDITLKVQAASTNHSSNRISIFKVATPAPAPDGQFIKRGQTLCSEDQDIFIEVPNNSIKQATLEAALLLLKLFSLITLLDKPGEAVVLLVVTFILSLPGAHALEHSNDICLIDSANPVVDGIVLEEGDNFKVAALILTVVVVGGASLWIMLNRRPKFQIDRGLEETPVATISNPVFEIHPMVECEEALLI